jgi:lambda repressor-like predicted transcriptional regulator
MADLADRLELPFPKREDLLANALDVTSVDNAQNYENQVTQLRETGFIKAPHPDIA